MYPCKKCVIMNYLLVSLILLLRSTCSNGARVLGVFHMPGKSHYILESSLMKGLADAGHDVTMVSAFEGNYTPKKGSYREIVLTGLADETEEQSKFMLENAAHLSPFLGPPIFAMIATELTEKTLGHKNLQALIHSNEKFDVVIVLEMMGDGIKALARHFNAHLVVFNAVASNYWINDFVGNPSLPSFTPDPLLSVSDKMSFWERVQNSFSLAIYKAVCYLYYFPKQQDLVDKYIPNGGNLQEALYNSSLVLMNYHESLSYAQNSVPSMINIGGFHLKPSKALPADLKEYLDRSTSGVVYFSMGSNLRSKDLPVAKRDMLMRTFGKLKQNVLWKFEDDDLPGKPENVRLEKWLPQPDILAHPNVKLFITHGGLLSTIETIYHGVPIIAIPIFGDQNINAKFAVTSGYARLVSYDEITEENLMANIQEILTNSKYSENIKQRSALMKDRKIHPMENAVYWVEYVIRHNGAKHLRMATLDLAWYQYYLLDVYSLIFVVVILIVLVLKFVCSWLCCRRRGLEKTKAE